MLRASNNQSRRCAFAAPGVLAVLITICLFVFSSCSSTPPDQKLLNGTPTPGVGTPSYTGRGAISPIHMVAGQSSLSTYPGGFMTLTIITSPFAVCTFVVEYGLTHPSHELGIIPRTADANGLANWHWRVESGAHTGSWPLSVSAVLANGAQTNATLNVFVSAAPISITSSSLSAKPGGDMTLSIATAPEVNCTITFALGPGGDARTLKAHANKQGAAKWSWNIGKKSVPGIWPMTITAILADGEQTTITVNVTVLPRK